MGRAQQTVSTHSRSGLDKAMQRVKMHASRNRWVGNNNRYREDCIGSLKQDLKAGRLNHRHLADYIAASAPLHCADGWSYLGRALQAHSNGDSATSLHLAYYAELRATMSLLACEGIGVFNRQHFRVDQNGKCLVQPVKTTHEFAKDALVSWSDDPIALKLLETVVMPGGISLERWLTGYTKLKAAWQPTARDIFRMWGVDLDVIREDKEARNEASYRPSQINVASSMAANDASAFLRQVWDVVSPLPASRFDILDKHFLRHLSEKAFEILEEGTAASAQPRYETWVNSMIGTVLGSDSESDLKRFLLRTDHPEDLKIIEYARTKAANGAEPAPHICVTSRALLLLRIATGACSNLLVRAAIGRNEIRFWWAPWGIGRGLWEDGNEPSSFVDLWADVEEAIRSLESWENTNASSRRPGSYAALKREVSEEIMILGSCERIPLWGLGL